MLQMLVPVTVQHQSFFLKHLNINKVICFEPNKLYAKILSNLNKKILVKNYAISDEKGYVYIYYPRYKSILGNFDLIPYTYYDKKKLIKQINLDFNFKNSLEIIKSKLYFGKIGTIKNKISLIKVDVNDHGFNVIKCLSKIIKKDRPALLVETDVDILPINRLLKKYGYKQYYYSIQKDCFYEIKKKYPLNTYFLQNEHIN